LKWVWTVKEESINHKHSIRKWRREEVFSQELFCLPSFRPWTWSLHPNKIYYRSVVLVKDSSEFIKLESFPHKKKKAHYWSSKMWQMIYPASEHDWSGNVIWFHSSTKRASCLGEYMFNSAIYFQNMHTGLACILGINTIQPFSCCYSS
jgi:hypothetical protein